MDTSSGWRNPIIVYLKDDVLHSDKIEVQKLQHMTALYILLGDIVYKKSYSKLRSDP